MAEQLICNQRVRGSNPFASSMAWVVCLLIIPHSEGRYPSGQRGQTVNLLALAFGGSNPPLPTIGEDWTGDDRNSEGSGPIRAGSFNAGNDFFRSRRE